MKRNEESELDGSLKILARGSVVVFAGIILSKLFTYLYRIIVARYYGPEIYGVLSLSLMVLGWFTIVAGLGLNNGLTRFISLYRGKKQNKNIILIFRKSFGFLLVAGLLAGILLFTLSDFIAVNIFHNSDLSIFLKLLSFTIPLTHLTGSFLAALKAYEKVGGYSFISKIMDTGTKLAIVLILILMGTGINAIPLSYLLGALITFIFALIYSKYSIPGVFRKTQKINKNSEMKKVFSYSWPLIFFGFAVALLHQTDSFMIGIFRSVTDVGYYNAAIPIALLITVSIDLFRQLFLPIVTKEYAMGNKSIVKEVSKQVGKWTFMLSLPLFILLIIFPGFFIRIIFGEEYMVAANALRFLAVGAMFTNIFEVSKELLSMKGRSKLILIDIIIVIAINFILNYILIPPYGIDGAAISTMISLILLGLIFAFQSNQDLGIIPLRKKMINIFLVGIISGSVVFAARVFVEPTIINLILIAVIFCLVYITGIFVGHCLDKNDYLILSLFRRKLHNNRLNFFKKNHQVIEPKDL